MKKAVLNRANPLYNSTKLAAVGIILLAGGKAGIFEKLKNSAKLEFFRQILALNSSHHHQTQYMSTVLSNDMLK